MLMGKYSLFLSVSIMFSTLICCFSFEFDQRNCDHDLDNNEIFNLLHDAMLTEFPDATYKVFKKCAGRAKQCCKDGLIWSANMEDSITLVPSAKSQ